MKVIMRINPSFPILKEGQTITYNLKGTPTEMIVRDVWYPKEGKKWSKKKARKHLGIAPFCPYEMFPQITTTVVDIEAESREYILFGDDNVKILKIDGMERI